MSDEVDRFPRVRRRHTSRSSLPTAASGISRWISDAERAGERADAPCRRGRESTDSVHITKTDSTGHEEVRLRDGRRADDAASAADVQPLRSVLRRRAQRRADAQPGDSVDCASIYIDREFDRFPLHDGVVRRLRRRQGRAPPRLARRLRRRDVRLAAPHAHVLRRAHDLQGRACERLDRCRRTSRRSASASPRSRRRSGGAKQLSVRDTARATIGAATLLGRLRSPARARTRAARRHHSVRRGVAHRRQRGDAVLDVGADHARRPAPARRHVHAVDRAAQGRTRGPHREQADRPVGHRLRSRTGPRRRRR